MTLVTETLQDLLERRLREIGQQRGGDLTLKDAYRDLEKRWPSTLTGRAGTKLPSYEVFRRITHGHTNITDTTADALATMLNVPVDDVLRAAGQRPRRGRFELPRRADQLDDQEREVVIRVIDALLSAGGRELYDEENELEVVDGATGDPVAVFRLHGSAGEYYTPQLLIELMGDLVAKGSVDTTGRILTVDYDEVLEANLSRLPGATQDGPKSAAARAPGKLSKGQQRARNAELAGEPEPDDPDDLEPR